MVKKWPGGGYWGALTSGVYNPKSGWEVYGTDPASLVGETNYINFHSYGPYTVSINKTKPVTDADGVRAVFAMGAGGIDEDLCWEYGQKWYNWYWKLNVPDNQKINNEQKNALLATGRDSLFQAMDRAYWAFNKGYNIPDPPPAPNMDVSGGPGYIEIKWKYPDDKMYKDPDTGIDDFYKWRLYRKMGSYWVYDDTDQYAYRKYELIGEFDRNTTSYLDKSVIKGADYHYCVTGVDDGSQNKDVLFPGQKLEGSYYANRNTIPVRSGEPGLDVSDQVIVVPNPYSISTGLENKLNWPGAPNDIHFMNLPKYCTIKIYTVTGELIKTFEHVNGQGTEVWENLRTDSNQYPVSGVYIAVIDNAQDGAKKPLPKQFVKFIIIR